MSVSSATVSLVADVLSGAVLPRGLRSADALAVDLAICWESLDDERVAVWMMAEPDCRGVGVSRELALAALWVRLAERREMISGTIEVLPLPTPTPTPNHPPTDHPSAEKPTPHPLLRLAGVFRDDADFAAIVAQLRADRELGTADLAYTLTAG